MPFAAVLDASVLYPLPLRDTLLRIAETELYDVYWSEHILHEVVHNLIADGRATAEQARRLTDTMTAAFEGAAAGRWRAWTRSPLRTGGQHQNPVRSSALFWNIYETLVFLFHSSSGRATLPWTAVLKRTKGRAA